MEMLRKYNHKLWMFWTELVILHQFLSSKVINETA